MQKHSIPIAVRTGCEVDSQTSRDDSPRARRPKILLVDDDPGIQETFSVAFRIEDLDLRSVSCGADAMGQAAQTRWDLWIVDLRLPDTSGLELVRIARGRGHVRLWIMISGFLSTPVVVEAMRLGASEVLDKPVDIDHLVAVTTRHLSRLAFRDAQMVTVRGVPLKVAARGGSAAARWAAHVLSASDADDDPKTLEQWARCIGVSYTSLCESCRLIGVQPSDARDFARTLRAKIHSVDLRCPAEVLLDISDRRTLRNLMRRAGPDFLDKSRESTLRFVSTQRFVNPDNIGLRAIVGRLLKSSA